ncbi:FitA-like ribbon-helix-helix domain-containing protein [Natronogracilivirga saccharolytica]|uniref:Antitoxin FitA-like ribbon-helix-helix domain-containing protein n=1 Tax=Natronogracilivirga saccharolytica TaxID=2812953 RepID=A0A8J7RT42_9BACT|nr:hypothetical protein [Natronogracilivirga saccharolytica]MBP3193349.1 hypothetical protein [Natronogracilivirga saccharolytica]
MTSITIRNLDKNLKARLRIQAARHDRSMEEEARSILSSSLAAESERPEHLADSIQQRFAPFGGVELPELSREKVRDPVNFDE